MAMIDDKGFTKMWKDMKKEAGISSSPWYKKADAAVSKYVEAYQKARKKAGEPDGALTEDISKVLDALKELDESLDKFMDTKGLNAIKDAPPEAKQKILKGITAFKKEVADETEFYNVEYQERLTQAKDVKEIRGQDAKKKLDNWEEMGAFGVKKDKPKPQEPVEVKEKIKSGEKPVSLDYAWWRARKPKDLPEDPKLKITMDYFWDHFTQYRDANFNATDNDMISSRINCLRQMTPGLNQSETAINKTIGNCEDGKHDNSKAALQHYLVLIKAYRLQRKLFVSQEKKRAPQVEGLQALLDEKLTGDPDY